MTDRPRVQIEIDPRDVIPVPIDDLRVLVQLADVGLSARAVTSGLGMPGETVHLVLRYRDIVEQIDSEGGPR